MTITQILPSHNDLTLSLSAWVNQLVDRFPHFDEYDVSEMIEEKTGLPVDQEDFESIRAFFLRAKLQAWSPEPEDADE